MNNGFITIYRKILDWEWYGDANTFRLFFHLLIKANHKEKKWQGVTISRGQILTGRETLSEELGISVSCIRTSLGKLKKTGEITIDTTNKYSVVTLVNYDYYQNIRAKVTSKTTGEQPTSDQQLTTNNNENNNNNEKKDNLSPELEAQDALIDEDSQIKETTVFKLPTNKFKTQNEEFLILAKHFNELVDTYPAVDVMQQFGEMKAWLNANPNRRKTFGGMKRFINNWLAKQQNRPLLLQSQQSQQRDFESLPEI